MNKQEFIKEQIEKATWNIEYHQRNLEEQRLIKTMWEEKLLELNKLNEN